MQIGLLLLAIKLAGVQVVIVVVHKPLPCVAATNVPSELLYFNISVLTTGKLGLAFHTVRLPLIESVVITPVSVAIIACVLDPG